MLKKIAKIYRLFQKSVCKNARKEILHLRSLNAENHLPQNWTPALHAFTSA